MSVGKGYEPTLSEEELSEFLRFLKQQEAERRPKGTGKPKRMRTSKVKVKANG